MTKTPWFKLYAADILADTAGISLEGFGALMRLRCFLWRHGRIAYDSQAIEGHGQAIATLLGGASKNAIAEALAFLKQDENASGFLIDPYLETQRDVIKQLQAAGLRGANIRWKHPNDTPSQPHGQPMASPTQPHPILDSECTRRERQGEASNGQAMATPLTGQETPNGFPRTPEEAITSGGPYDPGWIRAAWCEAAAVGGLNRNGHPITDWPAYLVALDAGKRRAADNRERASEEKRFWSAERRLHLVTEEIEALLQGAPRDAFGTYKLTSEQTLRLRHLRRSKVDLKRKLGLAPTPATAT